MSPTHPISGYERLTITERIELIQQLWDEIVDSPDGVELTQAQRAELDRRLAVDQCDPDSGIAWASLRASLARPK